MFQKIYEEHYYLLALVLITVAEACLMIPFFVPLFDAKMSEFYLVLGLAHILCLLLLTTKIVEVRPYLFHGLGTLGLFLSVIPYLNFLFHGILCFLGIRTCIRCVRYIKAQQAPIRKVED